MDTIKSLVAEFAGRIERAASEACVQRMLASVTGRRGGQAQRSSAPARTSNGKRKGPIQLCPIPRCKNRAAPVFGMLCADHQNTPKKLVAKYRELRRAKAK